MLAFKSIYQHVFKQNCLLCASDTQNADAICGPCLADLPWHAADNCQQCGLPANHAVCGTCLASPPHYDYTYAVFNYAYHIDSLLHTYKYHHALHLGETLGSLLTSHTLPSSTQEKVSLLIPMPLHPLRLQQRGFNQSLELAKVIAKQAGLALDSQCCQRIRNTPPQASLKLKDRVRNIKGAFQCTTRLDGQHVAIVDDVMTSGASLNELAKTLKQAGAATVSCWVIARTL